MFLMARGLEFKNKVKPPLEKCIEMLSLYSGMDIFSMEAIQRRFIRSITETWKGSTG